MAKHSSLCSSLAGFALFVFLFLWSGLESFSAEIISDPLRLQGKNQIELQRSIQIFLAAPLPKEKKDLDTWAQLSVAYASLERLAGNESTALTLLDKCAGICTEALSESQWLEIKKWACGKKKFVFCQ